MIGLAVLIGYAIKSGLGALDKIAPEWLHNLKVLTSFPLFPLCMIGGLILQNTAERVHLETLIDHGQMQRISGAALDFLVVSAVASIRIDVVTSYWQPLLILALCGTLWNVTMVLFIAPKIFKEAWFERSIAEFGQSMGVTATGLLLLRTVDPESKTVASQAFGYKQLLHEPFMGGGLITSLALPLVFSSGWLPFWLFSVIIVLMSVSSHGVLPKLKVWIDLFFPSDGSSWAMAGIDRGVIRQNHQFFLNAFEQITGIAAGEVGSPDTPGKKSVSGKQCRDLFKVK